MTGERLRVVPESSGDSCGPTKNGRPHSHVHQTAGKESVFAEPGFAGNVALVTLGCAKNQVDSEIMLGALKGRGFRPVSDPQSADLIIVNTCAFLQSAVEEGIDTILELANYKKSGRCRKLYVAGCMVERYREDLKKTLPEVDRFISTDDLLRVADESETSDDCFNEARRPYFLYDETMPRVLSTAGHSAFVKVSEGCDRPCTFCIIPKIRGSLRSRSIASIGNEVKSLLQQGVKEFNLVAQDLTAYGSDFSGNRGVRSELSGLLQHISKESEDFDCWIRLFYAYPIGVTEELVRQIVQLPRICNYLDLPLQHISGPVLKAMQRPLGEKGTRGLIEKVREIAPELALRTTFIVGFPGETEEDILSLEEFVSAGHFAHVGVFTYSQEKEAKSYILPDQIPEEIKSERRGRIMECQQAVVKRRLNSLVGTQLRVLIDGTHAESDLLFTGRTEWQGPETDGEVILNDISDALQESETFSEGEFPHLKGRFAVAEITEVSGYDLVGRLVSLED